MTLLESIKRYSKTYSLREDVNTNKINTANLDAKEVLSKYEQKKAKEEWESLDTDIESQKIIIKAAQDELDKIVKGEPTTTTALNYVWLKVADTVGRMFWISYLGPDPRARQRRIEQGAWTEWLAIAYEALTTGVKDYSKGTRGVLETFSVDKYAKGDIFTNLNYTYHLYLRNAGLEINYLNSVGGIANVKGGAYDGGKENAKVDSFDPTVGATGSDEGYDDHTFDDFSKRDNDERILKMWKHFCQDDDLIEATNDQGITPIFIFKMMLENLNYSIGDIHKKLKGVISRGSITNYLQDISSALEAYNLTYDDIVSMIKFKGVDYLTNYIYVPEELKKYESKTTASEEDIYAAFEKFAKEPSINRSPVSGITLGTVMQDWILGTDLSKKNKKTVKGKIDWSFNKIYKMFDSWGIPSDTLDSFIKNISEDDKEKLLDLIPDLV